MLESIVVTPHGRVVQLGEHLTGKQVVVLIKIYQNKGVIRACSSAGRAPALQVSRLNHISAASGVAYAETCGATTLPNWTEVGLKAMSQVFGAGGFA